MNTHVTEYEPELTAPVEADLLAVHDSSEKKITRVTLATLRAFMNSGAVVADAATLAVTAALHAGRTVVLDRAAGVTATLPAATGSGDRYHFVVKTTVTSNANIIQVANASDIMAGHALVAQDGGDTIVAFETAADTDTISGNGTTTGGVKGQSIELVDIAANLWWVRVTGSATGTEATPFSAAVS